MTYDVLLFRFRESGKIQTSLMKMSFKKLCKIFFDLFLDFVKIYFSFEFGSQRGNCFIIDTTWNDMIKIA